MCLRRYLSVMSQIKDLLMVTEENRKYVRSLYNKTEEDIQTDLNALLEWLEKQPHLPKDHDLVRLENSLLRNKFRVEQTKLKQDKYYTYRGVYSDFFVNLDPECDAIRNIRKSVMWVPMPKLLPTGERLIICNFPENTADLFNVKSFFTHMLIILDLQLSYDYAISDRYLVDVSNFTLKHIVKCDLNHMSKGFFLNQQAFSGRISRIDYLNSPLGADMFLAFAKQAVGVTIFGKIKLHNNVETLDIPKEYLPKEFGGEQESFFSLHDKWEKELVHQKDFLLQNSKRVSIENLRMGEPIHNELFGVEGTFKKINID